MKKEVIMPKIGLDMDEGTIIQWCKKVGDHVDEEETLLEIQTDKAITEVESSVSGTLVEILVQEEETVPIKTVIAYIEED